MQRSASAITSPSGPVNLADRNAHSLGTDQSKTEVPLGTSCNCSGAILDTIDLLSGYRNPVTDVRVKIDDLEFAPSSDPNDDPGKLSLFVADYGADQVNDGRLFEINLGDLLVA